MLENVKKRTWKYSDIIYWTNPTDGTCNAIIEYKGKKTRLRAATLIVKNGKQILLGEEEDEPGVFSLPGGGLEEGETPIDAAIREAQEEVFINITDVEDTECDYCECHDEVKDWVKENVPEDMWWYNYYSCLIIGEYKDDYEGAIEKEDIDTSMYSTSKWYNIEDVINDPSFKEQWKKALYLYGYLDKETLDEEYLTEKRRLELISKSRKGAKYKHKDINRWDNKNKCRVANTVKDYNKMDMDTFWKKDILYFDVKVQGETSNYLVRVAFNHILDRIQQKVKDNKNLLELKLIYKSLVEALNSSDVKVACTCPDFKYRFAYWATKNGINAGKEENREAKITNPADNLGDGCKHILCILNNADWVHKIASVINNYVAYAKENLENLYAKYIFPKIYGVSYQKAIQMSIFDYDENGEEIDKLKSDEATLNLSNALGRERGKIRKGSNKNPIAQERKKELEKNAKDAEKAKEKPADNKATETA